VLAATATHLNPVPRHPELPHPVDPRVNCRIEGLYRFELRIITIQDRFYPLSKMQMKSSMDGSKPCANQLKSSCASRCSFPLYNELPRRPLGTPHRATDSIASHRRRQGDSKPLEPRRLDREHYPSPLKLPSPSTWMEGDRSKPPLVALKKRRRTPLAVLKEPYPPPRTIG
jgi:hypothetical protein